MTQNYSFDEFFRDLKEAIVESPDESEKELIAIWGSKTFKTAYIPSDTFNDLYFKYISSKIKSKKQPFTDEMNNLCVKNALNVFYLDGDYKFNDQAMQRYIADSTDPDNCTEEEYNEVVDSFRQTILDDVRIQHMKYWLKVFENNNITSPVYTFEFQHPTVEGNKGGHHVFFVFSEQIDKDMRNKLCEDLIELVLDDEDVINDVCNIRNKITFKDYVKKYLIVDGLDDMTNPLWINKLFDNGPIITSNPLLLFAHKSGGKPYQLIKHNFKNITQSAFVGIMPIDSSQIFTQKSINGINFTSQCGDNEELSEWAQLLVDNAMKDEYSSEFIAKDKDGASVLKNLEIIEYSKECDKCKSYNDAKDNARLSILYSKLGSCVVNTLEFVQSLAYLAPNHKLFDILADHNERCMKFIMPLLKFLYVNILLRQYRELSDEQDKLLINAVTDALLDPITCTVRDIGVETSRHTRPSCLYNVTDIYKKYVKSESTMSDRLKKVLFTFEGMSKKEKEGVGYDEDDGSALEETVENGGFKFRMDEVNAAKSRIKGLFKPWIGCVINLILENITTEIEPFGEKEIMAGMSNVRMGYSFDRFYVKGIQPKNKAFYRQTVMTWVKMFVFILGIETKLTQRMMSKIVTAFLRYYIWFKPNAINRAQNIYIYNIRQTKLLSTYPYNQWIADVDGNNIKNWITDFYITYLEKALSTTNGQEIEDFLIIAKRAGYSIKERVDVMLKPFANLGAGIKQLFEAMCYSFNIGESAPLQPVHKFTTQDHIFPCHNGILTFNENDGSVSFSTSNKDIYTDVYTNVIYDPAYDTENIFYKRIEEMWEQTFPDLKTRIYMKYMIASCLSGGINKDQFLILYGTGGDGKSTFCNIIQSMLGVKTEKTSEYTENGITYTFVNPHGLSASMKTNTVLAVQKDGHDEGGRIELNGANFCTIQEPDQGVSGGKLNCSIIKELLSGSPINGRKIYQGSQDFIPNCLILLQTNSIPNYTEDTDGIRRRISLVPMQSKFFTATNEGDAKYYKYKYAADAKFATGILTDVRYWTAMFMSLLPYVTSLYKKGWRILSNVPKPKAVSTCTVNSFVNATGLMGWLNKCVKRSKGKCIQLADLINIVVNTNQQAVVAKNGKRLLEQRTCTACYQEALQSIQTKFHCIFRLKQTTEFYVSMKCLSPRAGIINTIKKQYSTKDAKPITDEALIEKYFEPNAVTSASDSQVKEKKDLFIIGYTIDPTAYDREDVNEICSLPDSDDDDDDATPPKKNATKAKEEEEEDTNDGSKEDQLEEL